MRLPTGELLALACPGKPHRALAAHRQGWTIETMFANLKTKGFNLEDTRIADPVLLADVGDHRFGMSGLDLKSSVDTTFRHMRFVAQTTQSPENVQGRARRGLTRRKNVM